MVRFLNLEPAKLLRYNLSMRTYSNEIGKNIGKKVSVSGWIHKIRKLGGITFLVIRDRYGVMQAVVEKKEANKVLADLSTESVVTIDGMVAKEERAPGGAEIRVDKVDLLSKVTEELPIEINKKEMNINLDTLLDWRPLSLRAPRQRAIFKVQAEILSAFRDFLNEKAFTEINTPKIVEAGLETGGAEMYSLKWFDKKAFLSQSPQMYKQIMVGVYERVFETAYIYRAEKHNTSRHLNEYLSMDLEMGFIDSFSDIMDLEEEYIGYLLDRLAKNCKDEFALIGAELPVKPKKIPRMKLSEAQEILDKEFGQKCSGSPDLDPNHEKMLCEYANKKYGTEFIFITHYPSKKRPFYTMDDPKSPNETLSFDLLFRGLEVTTGSQRLHLYEDYIKKMEARDMDPKNFSDYLTIFKYGMPPHGGLAIGAERITAKLLNLDNVREASLFPRDITRLRP
jgi:nondiscriminating aspartyl-tRNA synthetase